MLHPPLSLSDPRQSPIIDDHRYFAEKAGLDPSPYLVPDEDLYDSQHPITNVIRWAKDAGLQVILVSKVA